MSAKLLAALGMTVCLPALAAHAQVAPDPAPVATSGAADPDDPYYDGEDIVVTGQRLPGSVIGDVQPDVTFSPADIRSFGVSSLTDLLAELGPQTASGGGGPPVVLLDGRRTSSRNEIRDIPTEAIQRVEILPEDVALKYGYRADQRVVNIVLRRRFNAVTGEVTAAMPTAGGQFSPGANVSLLRLRNGTRLNLALDYKHSSALYESERGVISATARQPYDIVGNIAAARLGDEIDADLSTLLGRAATVIGVPAGAATGIPTLADFAAVNGVNTSDLSPYRTLRPETDTLSLNAVYSRAIGTVAATANGTLSYSDSDSAQGLARARLSLPAVSPYSPFAGDTVLYRYLSEGGALGQNSRSIDGHLGLAFNGALSGWQWSLTGNYDRSHSRTRTESGFDLAEAQARLDALDPLFNPYGPLALGDPLLDRARSTVSTTDVEAVVNGALFQLPAGAVSATIKAGGALSDFESSSVRSGIAAAARLSRDIAKGQASLDLPIASARRAVLPALGDLSVNVNFGYDQLSDFGGLKTFGYGLRWTPIKPVRIMLSVTEDEGAPTVQQLGNPTVLTLGARVFDYVRGETVDITRLSGGNPALDADDRRRVRLGVTVKPLTSTDLTFTANYTHTSVRDPIASFPAATAAIEAAFPERFTRDAAGQLTRIDSRPINFARQTQEQLRWGINFSKQIAVPPQPTEAERNAMREAFRARRAQEGGQNAGAGAPNPATAGTARAPDAPSRAAPGGAEAAGPGPGGPGGPGGFRGFGGGPGGRGGTQLQLAVYHTLHLRNEILVHDNGPRLDLLNGDTVGSSGGQARHEVEVQAGLTRSGLGARLSGAWQSGTEVHGGVQDLRFDDLATLNLRLFADLGQQPIAREHPILRGTRVTFSVTNLFNSRQRVTDATGATPISYQPAYLDALGRSVQLSIRKLFF